MSTPLWRGSVGTESSAWRNRNPGNLRPPSSWKPAGLIGTFCGASGIFCVFDTEQHGWQALATRILQMVANGQDTPREIISVWAPPVENNTSSYISGIAAKLGVKPDTVIDPRKLSVMTALANAIRQHEGKSSDPAWDPGQQRAGLLAAGCDDDGVVAAAGLGIGSQGAKVRELQNVLGIAGFDLVADGDFGPLTQTALKAYQRAHGLTTDGYAGPVTLAALGISA